MNRSNYTSETAACKAIAPKLGCSPGSLHVWCQQAERDAGQRAGLTRTERDRITYVSSWQGMVCLSPRHGHRVSGDPFPPRSSRFTTDAAPTREHLSNSRTVTGGGVAGTGIVGAADVSR